jgi:hypothetical protein
MSSPEPSSSLQPGAGDPGALVRRMDLRLAIASRIIREITDRRQAAIITVGRRLDADVARRFLENPESVDLSEFIDLDTDAAEILAACECGLDLRGLDNLSTKAAEALTAHNGDLCLDGLERISDEVAKALGRHGGGELSLNGLNDVSTIAAEALASRCGVSLLGLSSPDEEATEILHSSSGISLPMHLQPESMWDNVEWLEIWHKSESVTDAQDPE